MLGMRHGFPKVVITLAIDMFRAQRYVNRKGSVHGSVVTTQGMVAGCVHATKLLLVVMITVQKFADV